MSDVEKITFDNHYRRRADETASAWERKAAENAKNREKHRRIKSWMYFLTYACFMCFGASVSMSAVFAAMGDYGNLATCASAAFLSIIGAMLLSEKIER